MMKKKTSTKSARNTRLLLTGYWGYSMISGGNFLKSTLSAIQMGRRFKAKEKLRVDRESRRDQRDRKERKGRRTSIAGSFLFWSIVRKIFKAARVF